MTAPNTVSTIPSTIDALVALANNVATKFADAGTKIQVFDTAGTSDGTPTQLVIGSGGAGSVDGVEDTETLSGLRVDRDNENYSVLCLVSTWVGDGGFKPPRDLAYAVIDAFHDEIAADKTLGRVVMSARIAEAPYMAKFGGKGPTVSVPFRVEIVGRRALA